MFPSGSAWVTDGNLKPVAACGSSASGSKPTPKPSQAQCTRSLGNSKPGAKLLRFGRYKYTNLHRIGGHTPDVLGTRGVRAERLGLSAATLELAFPGLRDLAACPKVLDRLGLAMFVAELDDLEACLSSLIGIEFAGARPHLNPP